MDTIKEMNKRTVKEISDKALAVVRAELQKLGLTIEGKGGSYNSESYTMKIVASLPLKEVVGGQDGQDLTWGMAKRGTVAQYNGRKIVIVEAKRSKYVFYFQDEPLKADGTRKKYLVRFEGVSALKEAN